MSHSVNDSVACTYPIIQEEVELYERKFLNNRIIIIHVNILFFVCLHVLGSVGLDFVPRFTNERAFARTI